MAEEMELTRCQESAVGILDKLDGEEDPQKVKTYADAYKAVTEAEAKVMEANTQWSKACMEDEREKKKIENDYQIEKIKLLNDRLDKVLDSCEKVVTGAAVFGVAAVGTKAVIEMEEKGLFPSNMLSKEFLGKALKSPLEWVFKLFRH